VQFRRQHELCFHRCCLPLPSLNIRAPSTCQVMSCLKHPTSLFFTIALPSPAGALSASGVEGAETCLVPCSSHGDGGLPQAAFQRVFARSFLGFSSAQSAAAVALLHPPSNSRKLLSTQVRRAGGGLACGPVMLVRAYRHWLCALAWIATPCCRSKTSFQSGSQWLR
jgi:hypothetical protein